MRKKDQQLYDVLWSELDSYIDNGNLLPALEDIVSKDVFVNQLIDSVRRVRFATIITNRTPSQNSINPYIENFDPLRAAIYYQRSGEFDEACWLTFISTHFGKSKKSNWLLTQDVYKGRASDQILSWRNITRDLESYKDWIETLPERLQDVSPKRTFSNHRKYESLRPDSARPLYQVISSYRNTILHYGSHKEFFDTVFREENGHRYKAFDNLYEKLDGVLSFGRTAKFDFLTMLGKLSLVNIEPPKTYMSGSTGPRRGSKLLYGKNKTARAFEEDLFQLCQSLSINPFGMQVLEDALCNWQKSPKKYIYFKG